MTHSDISARMKRMRRALAALVKYSGEEVEEEVRQPENNTAHDLLVNALTDDRALSPLAHELGIDFDQNDSASTALRDPTTVHADAVRVLRKEGTPQLAVIIEVQLEIDPRKIMAWLRYYLRVYDREGCPTMLLILCGDDRIAAWATGVLAKLPIKNPGVVVGPKDVAQLFPDPDAVRAILRAIKFKRSRQPSDASPYIEDLFFATGSELWHEAAYGIIHYVFSKATIKEYFMTRLIEANDAVVIERARLIWGKFLDEAADRMVAEKKDEWRAEGEAKGKAKGEAEGEAKGEARGMRRALRLILKRRGYVLTDAQEGWLEVASVATLESWVERLLDDEPPDEVIQGPS